MNEINKFQEKVYLDTEEYNENSSLKKVDESKNTLLNNIRLIKSEINEIDEEIERISIEILNNNEQNLILKEKSLEISNEIEFRYNKHNIIQKRLSALSDPGNISSKEVIDELRKEIISQKVNTIIDNKIPILSYNNEHLLQKFIVSDYELLIDKHIVVRLSENLGKSIIRKDNEGNIVNSSEDSNIIKIALMKKMTFSEMKQFVCKYFNIEDPDQYVVENDTEALIYNESLYINEYLESYSLFSNIFILQDKKYIKNQICLTKRQDIGIDRQGLSFHIKHKYKNNENGNEIVLGNSKEKYIIKKFYNKYPLLNKYKSYKNKEYQLEPIRSSNLNTSFIVILITILYYILTIIQLMYTIEDPYKQRKVKNFLEKHFNSTSVVNYNDLFIYLSNKILPIRYESILENTSNENFYKDETFDIISKVYDFSSFLTNKKFDIKKFNSYLQGSLLKDYKLISDMLIGVYFISTVECKFKFLYSNIDKCYQSEYVLEKDTFEYEKYYNTSGILSIISKEVNQKEFLLTKKGISGYLNKGQFYKMIDLNSSSITIIDYMRYMKKNLFSFDNESNEINMRNVNFLTNINNRGLKIRFYLFNRKINQIVGVEIIFNLTPLGFISSQKPTVVLINFDYYRNNNYKVFDLVRIIIFLIFTLLYLFIFIKRTLKKEFSMSFLYDFLYSLLILILTIVNTHIKISILSNKATDFTQDSNIIIDPLFINYYSNIVFIIEAFLLFIVSFKILSFLKLNTTLYIYIETINYSMKSYIMLVITQIIYIILISHICYFAFSSFSNKFSSFDSSFSEVILMLMGNINISQLEYDDSSFFIVSLLVIILFYINFFIGVSVTISLMNDYYRVINRNNYNKVCQESRSWLIKDYKYWVFPFLDKNSE